MDNLAMTCKNFTNVFKMKNGLKYTPFLELTMAIQIVVLDRSPTIETLSANN